MNIYTLRNRGAVSPGALFALFIVLGIVLALFFWKQEPTKKSQDAPQSAEQVSVAQKSTKTQPKILVVHSYHPEYEWVASLNFGIGKALSGTNPQIENFYMDTKRKTALEWKVEVSRKALEIVDDWKPDVVITTDDNAQRFFGMQVGDRGKPALVFCGVNNPIETYNYPRPNITGVKETPHILDTIEFYRRLQPKAERFLFLSDNSPTSEGVVHYIKSNKRIGDFLVGVELPSSFEEWKSIVSNQGKQIDAILVYVYHTLSESTGSDNKVAPNDVLSWTIENSSVPVIALLSFAIDAGALGGVVESGVEQGYEAGLMAKKILEGTAPKDIPVKDVLKGKAMVNVKSAAHFGIRIPESEIEGKDIVLTGM